MIGFVVGLFVGAACGMVIAALLVSAGDPASIREQERKAGHW